MKTFLLLIAVFTTQLATSQAIEISENSKAKIALDFVPNIYLGLASCNSFRVLDSAKTVFGESLGKRADEIKFKTWSFNGGFRAPVSKFLTIDVGFSFNQSGESYLFEESTNDSSYSYTNRYRDIGMPIQLFASYGNSFRWFIGGGIQPHLAMNFRNKGKYTTENGSPFEFESKPIETLNGFSLSAVASAGFQWRWNKYTSIYFTPTYVLGLTNQYAKQEDFTYKRRVLELKFGICYNFKL